jgi:2,3-bisphosphoglycerate-dependent phosphoglycerate mutase
VQESLNDKQHFIKAWQLNERHYGALTGLNKIETAKKLGEEKIYQFRRSWDLRPDPLDKQSIFHPSNIDTYKNVPTENIPNTESLKDTYKRVTNYYELKIKSNLDNGNILISAHGNSIRALCKYLFKIDEIQISNLEIPTGNPLLIDINENQKIKSCKYLDQNRAKDLLIF